MIESWSLFKYYVYTKIEYRFDILENLGDLEQYFILACNYELMSRKRDGDRGEMIRDSDLKKEIFKFLLIIIIFFVL